MKEDVKSWTVTMRSFPNALKEQVKSYAFEHKAAGNKKLDSGAAVVRYCVEQYFSWGSEAKDEKRREEEILEKQVDNPIADEGDLW